MGIGENMELLTWDIAYFVFAYIFIIIPMHELGHYAMAWAFKADAKFVILTKFPNFGTPAVHAEQIARGTWRRQALFALAGPIAGLIPILLLYDTFANGLQIALLMGYFVGCISDIGSFFEAGAIRNLYGNTPLYHIYAINYMKLKRDDEPDIPLHRLRKHAN